MKPGKINVLYVSHESGLNGSPRSLIGMIDCLAAYINPFVVIPCNGNLEDLLVHRNINYAIVPFINGHGEIGKHIKQDAVMVYNDNIKAARVIVDIITKNRIDLVHSNSSVVDVGAIAAILSDKPHLWHLREFCEEDFGIEYLDKEWKKMLFSTSNFFTISDSIKDSYYKKYQITADIAYDFVDPDDVQPKTVPFSNDIVYIIIAGYISRGKCQIDAVRAIDILVRKKVNNVRLIVIGSGAQRYIWSIEKYIEANGLQGYVKILPFSNNIDEIRNRCDISLTCSKMEGLGRVTMEAMLAGITVIGANTGGTKELIGENQERGYLYEQGNYSDLAVKIEFVLNDKAGREKKIDNARAYIQEQANAGKYAARILEAYKKCISGYPEKELYKKMVTAYISSFNTEREIINKSNDIIVPDIKPSKFKAMFFLAEKWIRIRQKGNSLGDFIRKHGYKTVAIYGMGYLGCVLYDELNKEQIQISYVIDRVNMDFGEWISLLKPEDNLPLVDIIIVTVVADYADVLRMLCARYPYSVISLSDILEELMSDEY